MERAALSPLYILAAATATAFLFAPVRHESVRLLRRTRWLMLVLLLTYAYALPGPSLWPELGAASPSIDGLGRGALRAARLTLLLVGLAVLLAYTPRARLIYGLYFLTRPLTWFGFDRRAFAVRIGLTLDYVEHAPKPTRWLDRLRTPLSDEGGPVVYNLEAERWQSRDSAVILASLFLLWIVLA